MTKLRKSMAGAFALAMLLAATPPDAPVADAAMRGDVEAVRALIKQGADVNAAHGDGMTALHWAAEHGSVEMAQILVTAGASTSSVTRHGGFTPLHVAARTGRGGVVKALVDAGADPNVKTATGATPLHQAAGAGSLEAVEALLAKGAEVDARENQWQQTPLIFAASYNRPDVIRALLRAGADPNTYTRVHSVSGQRAIDQAGAAARRAALEAFKVKDGNDPNWRPTPAQVQAAVRAGQAVQKQGPNAAAGQSSEIDLGGGEGAGTAADTQGGLTPLLHATRNGHKEATIALLEGGADINLPKKGDEYTPVTMAMINGNYDLGLMLLERGADINKPAADGTAPLFAVISNYWGAKTRYPQPMNQVYQNASHLETMETLLKAGADVNARLKKDQWYLVYTFGSLGVDMTGATPFWRAAHAVDLPAMKLLIKYGADPNIPTIQPAAGGRRGRGGAGGPDPSGLPPVAPGGPNVYPIHAAAGVAYGLGFTGNFHQHAPNGWLPSVKYLVDELGADVNVRDAGGYSALHHAASRGDNDMILYLVSKGADPMVVSRAGQTTVDMANGPGQRISPIPATIELLEKLGAKNNNRCVSC